MIGKIINKVINPFGFKIERTVESNSPSDADGYAEYLKQATNMGMDVNDYLTTVLGWPCPLSTLKSVLFPYINPSSNIIEIGQGTGRASRHLANYLSSGNLLLADVSEWFTNFSVQYFHDYGNVIVKKINNKLLPNFDNCVPNVLFAEGVFTYLPCLYIYIYIYLNLSESHLPTASFVLAISLILVQKDLKLCFVFAKLVQYTIPFIQMI
jgi:hypothetical protein